MGVMGELFPGQKLNDDGGSDSEGQPHRPRLDLDLDAGVVRLSGPVTPPSKDDQDGSAD